MTKAELDAERDRQEEAAYVREQGESYYSSGVRDGWDACYEYLAANNLLGPAIQPPAEPSMTSQVKRMVAIMGSFTVNELVIALSDVAKRDLIDQTLRRMVEDGTLVRLDRGRYSFKDADTTSECPK